MLAFKVTRTAALIVIPLASSRRELPFLSSIRIEDGPSCRVILCPAGVSKISWRCPSALMRRQQLTGLVRAWSFMVVVGSFP